VTFGSFIHLKLENYKKKPKNPVLDVFDSNKKGEKEK